MTKNTETKERIAMERKWQAEGGVWACLKGKKKTHHNYRWEYESEVV